MSTPNLNVTPLEINSKIHNNIILSNGRGDKKPISFPSGMLLVWNKPDNIPEGWTKCDGGIHAKTVLKRTDTKLNNGQLIPDFQGKMLRMYNPRDTVDHPITAKSDRKFKGYSSSNMYSKVGKHKKEGTGSSGGYKTTTMLPKHMPQHSHRIHFDKSAGSTRHRRIRNRFTQNNSSNLHRSDWSNTFKFQTTSATKARDNMPPHKILTYIVKL